MGESWRKHSSIIVKNRKDEKGDSWKNWEEIINRLNNQRATDDKVQGSSSCHGTSVIWQDIYLH